MKRGLVLEGGGAKGAYHCGVVKVLYENGYTFDGIAGTSIGAINGAMIVQDNGVETMLSMWNDVKIGDIANIEEEEVKKLLTKQFDKDTIKYWVEGALKVIGNRGLETDRAMNFLKNYIDEDKVRKSKMEFAIVTYCLSDKKPMIMYLEDIPQGKLVEYIFASAYYPAFRLKKIDGKFFIDGGIYDNLPINPLLKIGYDEIIAVRTNRGKTKTQKLLDTEAKISYITPSEYLGRASDLNFDRQKYNFNVGEYDALRYVKNYKGDRFYFSKMSEDDWLNIFYNISDNNLEIIENILDVKDSSAFVNRFEVIKKLRKKKSDLTASLIKEIAILTDRESDGLAESIMQMCEYYAMLFGMEKFAIYTFEDFLTQLKSKYEDYVKIQPKFNAKKINEIFSIIILGEINRNDKC